MTSSRDVSAVVPTRNRASLLRRTLASVVEQEGDRLLEVLVVEQESTDDTPALLASIASALAGGPVTFRVIEAPPSGPAAARNLAIREAAGSWIAFCDDDDYWAPDKLLRQAAALDAADAGWGGTGTLYVDDDGKLIGERTPEPSGTVDSLLGALIEENVVTSTSTVMARRSLLLDVGGFREDLHFGEDWLTWIELGRRARAVQLAASLTATRISIGSATSNVAAVQAFLDALDGVRGAAPDAAAARRWRAHREVTMSVAYLRSGQRVASAAHRAKAAVARRSIGDAARAGYLLVAGADAALGRAYRPGPTGDPGWLRDGQ